MKCVIFAAANCLIQKNLAMRAVFFKNPVVSAEQFAKIQKQVENLPHFPQADGSVKLAAGWLIDQCHLKRFSNRWCSRSSTAGFGAD